MSYFPYNPYHDIKTGLFTDHNFLIVNFPDAVLLFAIFYQLLYMND